MKYSIFKYLFICLLLNHIWSGYASSCQLRKRAAYCSGMHFIPVIPGYIKILVLRHNFLPDIRRESFRNISSIRLAKLSFRNNSLEKITSDAFSDLKFLNEIEFKYENKLNMDDLKFSFGSLNFIHLQILSLESNNWTILPNDMFDSLKEAKNLSLISLNNNKLTNLDSISFSMLSGLKEIYCRENAIVYVNTTYFKTLENLDLKDNNIFLVLSFCRNNDDTFPSKLKNLSLENNAIRDISPTSFRCLSNLQNLILDGNRMKNLHSNIFAPLDRLKSLSLSHLCHLKGIQRHAFNISSLEILKFSENAYPFHRSKYYNPVEIFLSLPKLKDLDLTKNYLPKNETKLQQMLGPLTNLRKLNLFSTFISSLPDDLLQTMPYLNTLILSGNKINRWNPSLFQNMSSLRYLFIAGNLINIINETSFPKSLLTSLQKMDLSTNPFWCTCEQKWFIDMVRATKLEMKLLNWPHHYSCYYPEHLKFSELSKYNPTVEDCSPFKVISVIIIITSTAVFIFLTLVFVVFRCQTNIRNIFYFIRMYRRVKKGYLVLKTQDDFEFDAFIVYCDADRQWVHEVLLRKLENSGLKICVHYRDFEVGQSITTNIEKYMNESWKIIVVMSNHFARSEWCQWEIDLVQERRRRQGKEALILIMYHQIDSMHMTSPLRTLLDTTPHLNFQEGFGEHLFWTTVIKAINRPLRCSPIAVF